MKNDAATQQARTWPVCQPIIKEEMKNGEIFHSDIVFAVDLLLPMPWFIRIGSCNRNSINGFSVLTVELKHG